MQIAAHHRPGTREAALDKAMGFDVPYTPACPWPDDCMVQWGNGIIPANPFFEAFPPGTFIRGDGETIEEAERKAFAQYEREGFCDHVWGRKSATRGVYLNGAGWCRKCGAFRSEMFPEVVVLSRWRKPLERFERDHLLRSESNDDGMNEWMAAKCPQDEPVRRRYQRLLRIRLNLFGVDEESSRMGFAPKSAS